MSELKPCPFCGGEPVVEGNLVACNNLNCPTHDNYWTDPMIFTRDQWNNRPIEDELHARIAELESTIERLIEAGNGMKSFLTPYVDGFRDSYPATSAWESLVKDWKERKE